MLRRAGGWWTSPPSRCRSSTYGRGIDTLEDARQAEVHPGLHHRGGVRRTSPAAGGQGRCRPSGSRPPRSASVDAWRRPQVTGMVEPSYTSGRPAADDRSCACRRPRPSLPSSRHRAGVSRSGSSAEPLGLGSRWRARWRSCAAGSPATTRSTSSASTPTDRQRVLPPLRPLYHKWFRVEIRRPGQHPDAGGALVVGQPLRHHRAGRADDQVALHDEHPRTGTCGCSGPTSSSAARRRASSRARAAPPWPAPRTPSGCCARRAGRGLAGGLQGHRQAVQRALQAAAVRPRRLRLGGAAHRRCRSCRCRSSGPRRSTRCSATCRTLARLLGLPVRPDHADFPLLGPARRGAAAAKWLIEFGEPIETRPGPEAADDPMLVFNLTDQVRETIQQTLYSLLMQRKSVFPGRPLDDVPAARGRSGPAASGEARGRRDRGGQRPWSAAGGRRA